MKIKLYMFIVLGLVMLLSTSCAASSNADISVVMEETTQLNKELSKYSSGMQRQGLVDIEQNADTLIQKILEDDRSIKLGAEDVLADQSNFFIKISNIDTYKKFQSRFIVFGNKNLEEAAQTYLYLQYWGEDNEPKVYKLYESNIDSSSIGKLEHYSIIESGNTLQLLVVEKWEGPENTFVNMVTYRYSDNEWVSHSPIGNGAYQGVMVGEFTEDINTNGWFIDHKEGENRYSISYSFSDSYEKNEYDFEISNKGIKVFVLQEGTRIGSLSVEYGNVASIPVKADIIWNNEGLAEEGNLFIEYHPIVYDGILMGGYIKHKWYASYDIAYSIKGGEKYKLYSFEKLIGEATGSKVIPPDESEPDTAEIELSYTAENLNGILAVNGEWNALPRSLIKQNNNSDIYKNIITDLLRDKGLEGVEINVTQNYRVDLEGDGSEEVIICTENVSPLTVACKKGTYSVIILRKMINGKVENIFLREAIYLKDGEFSDGCTMLYSIKAIADVNGDGIMEILLGYNYYEGFGYDLIEIRDNKAIEVLSNGINIG